MRDRIFEHRFCETEVIMVAVLVALYCTFRNNALETFKWGDRILLKRIMSVCVQCGIGRLKDGVLKSFVGHVNFSIWRYMRSNKRKRGGGGLANIIFLI